MHAEVLVGIHRVALAHHKSLERPVSFTDLKFPAARIIELIQAADGNFLKKLVRQVDDPIFVCLTTKIERIIDGMPSAAA